MRRFQWILAVGFLLSAGSALAADSTPASTATSPSPSTSIGPAPSAVSTSVRTVTYSDAMVLGLVEGVTEYLPISSTGHLILTARWLGLDLDTPLLDRSGQQIFTHHHNETNILTLKDAVDAYNIIIQGGAILAVLLLFRRKVWSLVLGVMGRDANGLRLLRNLLLAFTPSAAVGLLAERWIDAHLMFPKYVALALAAGALAMLAAEFWRKKNQPTAAIVPGPELHELSVRQALFIGLCQCASLWPGTSRSMTAMVGGYFVGLRPARAAEFSFLLGLMTLTAASGYKAVGHGRELIQGLDWGPLALGLVVATVSAFLAVKWFVGWLSQHGLNAFAWYRLVLAIIVLATMP